MKNRKYGIELLQLLPEPFRSSHQNSLNSYKRGFGRLLYKPRSDSLITLLFPHPPAEQKHPGPRPPRLLLPSADEHR